MEKNNTSASDYSKCKKVREALATCPALRAINNRFSGHHQEYKTAAIDSKSPSSSPTRTTAIQTKPAKPPHPKVNSEEAEAIPIKFDYSTPAVVVASPHVKISETVEKTEKAKGDTEQQGKKDMDRTFSEYIQIAKRRIRTVSNAGRGLGEPAPRDEANNAHGIKKKDNHKEHFSNFIHRARMKIRTTPSIRKE